MVLRLLGWRVVATPRVALAQRLACRASRCGKNEDREYLLRGVLPENRELAARAVEQAQAACERWEVSFTDFLEPPAASDCALAVGRLADAEARPWGGYPHAERVRLRLGRPETLDAEPAEGVALLVVEGSFMFDAASHRDFLGALLGTGIERSRVGDLVVQGERGAHVLATPEMAVYLAGALTQVRSVRVACSMQPLSALRVTEPKMDTIRTAEASLRLDAVASAGWRVSRGKMAESIEAGDVRLNWRSEGVKTSTVVKSGDVISIRGRGRLTVGEVSMTKKERYSVELHRLM